MYTMTNHKNILRFLPEINQFFFWVSPLESIHNSFTSNSFTHASIFIRRSIVYAKQTVKVRTKYKAQNKSKVRNSPQTDQFNRDLYQFGVKSFILCIIGDTVRTILPHDLYEKKESMENY